MRRAARRIRAAGPALLALASGCAHHAEEAGTSAYVLGSIFVLIGLIAGVALIFSLNE